MRHFSIFKNLLIFLLIKSILIILFIYSIFQKYIIFIILNLFFLILNLNSLYFFLIIKQTASRVLKSTEHLRPWIIFFIIIILLIINVGNCIRTLRLCYISSYLWKSSIATLLLIVRLGCFWHIFNCIILLNCVVYISLISCTLILIH